MPDLTWPDDLVPYQQLFYLQPHTGGSESPFTKQTKTYGLSAPRWICRMVFRGGYDGTDAQGAFGPRLDAIIADLQGRFNRIAIYDFRRTAMRGLDVSGVGNEASSAGTSEITLTGLVPGEVVLVGDYLGGDGRPHIITGSNVTVASDGTAVVTFKPALADDIAEDAAVLGNPTGIFKLVSDDAGTNLTEVGGLAAYDLEFVEDLGPPVDVIYDEAPLTYSG